MHPSGPLLSTKQPSKLSVAFCHTKLSTYTNLAAGRRWRRLLVRRTGSSASLSPSCPMTSWPHMWPALSSATTSKKSNVSCFTHKGWDVSHNPGLQGLLQQLSRKADEAEDALDELHYFIIQDQLDGTHEATIQEPAPEMGDVVRAHARHGRHAVLHTVGNCLRCFSCSPKQDDDCAAISVANNPHNTTKSDNGNDGVHVDKLSFNRVEMSLKIKSVIEDIHSLCGPVSDLLSKIPNNSTTAPLTRPQRGSAIVQDKLYGRGVMFEKTVDDITSCGEALSVLPIVGPGGIGKTTFTQHLYNNARAEGHFSVRVWVCVSTAFDVLELTKQILSCIPASEKEGSHTVNETSNLSKLQEHISERLKSKRFLVVLDDMWKCDSKEDWETLLAPFTKGEAKGSMVLITTRFPKLADMMKTIDPIELQGLDSNDFFTFFEECIFGENHKTEHYEDDLTGIAREIANKLKGSPLAAKTVGRLLKKNLSLEHWNGVLQKHEWLNQQNNDDIMPSLKISYDYLPFDLKKCFSYCALYPEDYRFDGLEINRLWIAIGIIDSSPQVDRNYLEELVDNGFLMKRGDACDQYYTMHDLMHELCRSVSAHECLNISNLDFKAEHTPPSIRHLSITIRNRYDEKFLEEMGKLKRRIGIANLRTLIIFRGYEECHARILKDIFKEIHGLRVLFTAVESVESLPQNFSKLIHLQYLKIESFSNDTQVPLPSTLSRFYHLKFLDLKGWYGSSNLPKDFNRLVNLRDFIAKEELHSNVSEVGKMKFLLELKEFHVKKESVGFELRELGQLTELGGTLSICNLENVATNEEASDLKLMLKGNLKEVRLVWGTDQPAIHADVIDLLKPHSDLRALGIKNHVGTSGPSWLCLDIWVKRLETLHLEAVSWVTLPPLGQLPHLKELILKRISAVRRFVPDFGGVTDKSFLYLKTVVFRDMPELVDWGVEPNCHLFPRLESIKCTGCPNLIVIPFLECSFTNLCSLEISQCPKLSLPPMPHTSRLTHIEIARTYSESLSYNGVLLRVCGYSALVFRNLDKVDYIDISCVSDISLSDLGIFKSLRGLTVGRCDSLFSEELDDSIVFCQVQHLRLMGSHFTRKALSNMLNCFPALSSFEMSDCSESHEEQLMQFPSSSSLQKVELTRCRGLVLVPAEDAGEIQEDIMSLQSLRAGGCGKLFSRWPMGEAGGAQAIKPFPSSLRELDIYIELSMKSMHLFSNLTSLTRLSLVDCKNFAIDGFNPLITSNLKELKVHDYKKDKNCPYSIGADMLAEVARSITTMPAGSFQLEILQVDNICGVLVAPVCNLFASTLHTLSFWNDKRAENFTEEQEKALQLLTSLKKLEFINCMGLQSFPQGLNLLSSLKELRASCCRKLRCLPEQGFHTSLQVLDLGECSAELKEQAEELKARNPDLIVMARLATEWN